MVRLNMSQQSTSRRVFLKASAAAAAGAVLARDLAAAEPAVGPTAAQKAWMRLGYGMFIHFGPNTILGVGWGDGKFPPRGSSSPSSAPANGRRSRPRRA